MDLKFIKNSAVQVAIITVIIGPIIVMGFEWVFKPNTISKTKSEISTITISDNLIRKKTESVVLVKNNDGQVGTGFMINPKFIITSTNIAKGYDSIDVYRVLNQNPNRLSIVNRDIDINTAIMKVKGKFADNSAIEINPTSTNILDKIFTIGYGFDQYKIIREGRIVNITENSIVADLAIIPGMTGAPVFNKDGELIGMVLSANISAQIAMIIPTKQIINLIENTEN